MNILDPRFDPNDAIDRSNELTIQARKALFHDLNTYRKIYNHMGRIERPDFENESNLLKWRKNFPI